LLNHLPVRGTLLLTHSLHVNVHRGGNVGVPQQFLLHFHIGVLRMQQARSASFDLFYSFGFLTD